MSNSLNQSIHEVVEEDLIADIEPVIESVIDVLNVLPLEKMRQLTRHHEMVVLAVIIYGLLKTHLETERRLNEPDIKKKKKSEILSHYSDGVRRLLSQWESHHPGANKEEWYYALMTIDWMVSCGHTGSEKNND